jgi:hypothetical protein
MVIHPAAKSHLPVCTAAGTLSELIFRQILLQFLNQLVSVEILKQLNEASQAAQSLQTHLNNAFDIKTGNLDLGKF